MVLNYSKWDAFQDSDEEKPVRSSCVSSKAASKAVDLPEPPSHVEPESACIVPGVPYSDAFIQLLEPVPKTREKAREVVGAALASGSPIILQGALVRWPALKSWTFDFFMQERFGAMQVRKGNWRGSSERVVLRDIIRQCSGEPPFQKSPCGTDAVGCYTWRFLEDCPDLEDDVGGKSGRIVGLPEAEPPKSSGVSYARVALSICASGYVPTPLRTRALCRHCCFASLRGSQRYVVLPAGAGALVDASGEDDKGRRSSPFNPLQPDFERWPEARNVHGLSCILEEGEALIVPSGCFVWSQSLSPSLVMRRCFVTSENMLQYQQWYMYRTFHKKAVVCDMQDPAARKKQSHATLEASGVRQKAASERLKKKRPTGLNGGGTDNPPPASGGSRDTNEKERLATGHAGDGERMAAMEESSSIKNREAAPPESETPEKLEEPAPAEMAGALDRLD